MKPSIKELQFYSDIGIAYAKNKQFKKAFEAFTEYEKLYPNSGRAFSNWIIYFALQD